MCSDITEHTCIVAEAVGWRLLCAGRRGAREGPCGGRGTWSYCWRQVELSWPVVQRVVHGRKGCGWRKRGGEERRMAHQNPGFMIVCRLQEEEALGKARAEEEVVLAESALLVCYLACDGAKMQAREEKRRQEVGSLSHDVPPAACSKRPFIVHMVAGSGGSRKSPCRTRGTKRSRPAT